MIIRQNCVGLHAGKR